MSEFYYQLNRKYRDRISLISGENELTYGELAKTSDDIAKYVKSRSTVLMVCSNNIESISGYIGFLSVNAVPLMISTKNDSKLFTNLVEAYQPSYIYLPSSSSWVNFNAKIVHSSGKYTLLRTRFPHPTIHDDLALLLATSGSTGSPKFVRLSYENIESNAKSIVKYLSIKKSDRPITTMPMSYSYGLSIINSHLLMGSSIILTDDSLMDRSFWEKIKMNKATTFGGVPYIYEMLRKLRFERMQIPSLKYLTQAGGNLNSDQIKELVDVCTEKNLKFYVMYGQTEASPRMSYVPWENAYAKAGSIGIAIPGGELMLEDEKRKIIKEYNTIGELIYCGDNVSMGYAEGIDDLGKGDDNKGKLYTGDYAYMDSDGYYYLTGRKKRFLKMYGNRVNLDDVENYLNKVGYDCVCAGSDNNLKIYIAEPFDSIRLIDYVSKFTGLNRTGFQCVAIDRIPRNDSGKVLYSELL